MEPAATRTSRARLAAGRRLAASCTAAAWSAVLTAAVICHAIAADHLGSLLAACAARWPWTAASGDRAIRTRVGQSQAARRRLVEAIDSKDARQFAWRSPISGVVLSIRRPRPRLLWRVEILRIHETDGVDHAAQTGIVTRFLLPRACVRVISRLHVVMRDASPTRRQRLQMLGPGRHELRAGTFWAGSSEIDELARQIRDAVPMSDSRARPAV
jgi:hypothetical protein